MKTKPSAFIVCSVLLLLLLALSVRLWRFDQRIISAAKPTVNATPDATASTDVQPRLLSADTLPAQSKTAERPAEPAWAVPYGKEFWRQPAARVAVDPKRSATTNLPASLNIGDVIERVRHALKPNEIGANPALSAATYAASFDERGLVFSPHKPGAASDPGADYQSASASEASANMMSALGDRDAESRLQIGALNRRYRDAEADKNVRAPQADPKTLFTLRTVGVRQENVSLYAAGTTASEWSYVGNTAQSLLNGQAGLVEHYELRSEGAHVTWVLGQKPSMSGPVTIEVATVGLSYAGQTEKGQHFADDSGTARVCVGQATAVDATGKTWPLVMAVNTITHPADTLSRPAGEERAEGTTCLNISIPASVLAEATYPMAIDPVVGPEFGMDNPVWSPGGGGVPSVAANGTDWLVAWVDYRNYNSSDEDIYGARVNASGVVLDSSGIAICTATNIQYSPSVAAKGPDWLVVWFDGRSSSDDIYGTRVNSSGTVLDSSGIAICTAANNQERPFVAANGTEWLVVWEDYRDDDGSGENPDIYGTRVNSSGVVLDGSGIPICVATNHQTYPSVAANGSNWLVVWFDGRSSSDDIYGTRVNSSGTVLDTSGIAICTAANNQYFPSVAANGTDWLVVWSDGRNGSSSHIYGTRVNSSGAVLDSDGFAICTAAKGQRRPRVAANGTDWLVVWEDYRNDYRGNGEESDVYGARVNASGVVLDSSEIAICTAPYYQGFLSLAANGTNWLVAWHDNQGSFTGVRLSGARVSGSGVVLDSSGITISTWPNSQSRASVAANGTDWLVVWQDYRNGVDIFPDSDIYGARVNDSGVVLDTSGIAICTTTNNQVGPSVAANGTDWLVVWCDSSSYIYGARVNASGVVLDSSGIKINWAWYALGNPSVSANGTNWLVVWEDRRNGTSYQYYTDIYGARVDGNGVVLDPGFGIAISTGGNNWEKNPRAAWNGTGWLVVWGASGGFADIWGARVSGSGVTLDRFAISTATGTQMSPSVAANGTDWLVVWRDSRNDASSSDIYGARVNGSGTVLDGSGIAISTAANWQVSPAVAANGMDWLVVWHDLRNGGYDYWSDNWTNADIYGTRVSGSGDVLDATGFAINTHSGDQTYPAVADMRGQYLVVYDGPAETDVRRIRANKGTTMQSVEIVTQPASRTNNADTTATFSVMAFGLEPISYQWIKNGTNYLTDAGNVFGTTTATLTLSNVFKADEGSYSVVVTNTAGTDTSSHVTLTVIDPMIIGQPTSQDSEVNQNVTLSVAAAGTPPLSYQWWKNGAALAHGTDATLMLTNVQSSNAGSYSVVVSNHHGSVTSTPPAVLKVLPTVFVVSPPPDVPLSNSVVCVHGIANGSPQIAGVWYQLNFDSWELASSTNGWTNWTACVQFRPGINDFLSCAMDTAGNWSQTNSVSYEYVPSGMLATLYVAKTGMGIISPNYSGALLEIGQSYSMAATGAEGYAFSRWIVSTNWMDGLIVTTNRLSFVMQPNLTLLAIFVERPRLLMTWPPAEGRFQFQLVSAVGAVLEVQGSTNLTNWEIITTLTNYTGTTLFTDMATNFTRRFYRAEQQ